MGDLFDSIFGESKETSVSYLPGQLGDYPFPAANARIIEALLEHQNQQYLAKPATLR
jgi:hypothetical protein